MAGGIVQLEIIDGSGTPTGRAIQVFSTTGTIAGDLYPLQMIVGNDGVNPSGPSNPLTVLATLGNSTGAIGSVSISGGNLTSGGNVTVTAVPANMTVIDEATVAQGATVSGLKGILTQGAVATSAPTLTTGQTAPPQMDTSGNTRVVDATVAAAITAAAITPSQIRLLGTAIIGNSGNLQNAAGNATLAGTSGKTTYLNDVMITAAGATAGLAVTGNITGLLGGTRNFTFVFPLGNATAAAPFVLAPPQPLPASSTNTPIVINLPASGTGGLAATVSASGFQL